MIDKTMEAFAGPHDYMGSWGYTSTGLINTFSSFGRFAGALKTLHSISAVLLIPVAAPFAAASFLDVWSENYVPNATSSLMNLRNQRKYG